MNARLPFALPTLFALVAAVLLATIGASPLSAQDADEIFERLKQKYESIDALRAEFSQTMTSSYMDEEATSRGVLIASGDRYRVETEDQTLVTDGRVTWVYMPSQNQLLINDNTDDEESFSVSELLFNYDEQFTVTDVTTATVDGESHYVLSLEPRSRDAFFTEATMSMRARDAIVTRLQILDVNGTTMIFDLTNIELDPPLDAGVFTFTPPKGTEIVDLRS